MFLYYVFVSSLLLYHTQVVSRVATAGQLGPNLLYHHRVTGLSTYRENVSYKSSVPYSLKKSGVLTSRHKSGLVRAKRRPIYQEYAVGGFSENSALPKGRWIDSSQNASISMSSDGPILHADMLCGSAENQTVVHVDMLYVPMIEYRWENHSEHSRVPICRFNWDNNNHIPYRMFQG